MGGGKWVFGFDMRIGSGKQNTTVVSGSISNTNLVNFGQNRPYNHVGL
jgi:hypothetical protein